MRTNEVKEREESKLSRRRFLTISGAGLSFGVVLGVVGVRVFGSKGTGAAPETTSGPWVRINADGEIVIYSPVVEMGQGSMTALPIILAEEMDADWSKVRIEHSPIEPDVYGIVWGRSDAKRMTTVASIAVRGYFSKLRIAGAQIRRALLDSVAREWDVAVAELTTEPSTVVHAASGRRISYGEIAAFAELPSELPEVEESQLKSPSDFRLIGHSFPRHDIPAKTDGSAEYSIDVHVPGMLYGMIARSPVHNGRPASYNEAEVRAMPRIITTLALDHGIGVIGESIEAVIEARDVLSIEWAAGAAAEDFDSEAAFEDYAEIVGGDRLGAQTITQRGDAQTALQKAVKRYEADFLADYIYHAQMEPLNAVVSVNEPGDGAEVWVGTQSTSDARAEVARVLGVGTEGITLHPCYLGGGFGRRISWGGSMDYVVEAVHLSDAVKRPVKLMWTREDDLQYGMFRPMCLQRLTAGVDEQGNISAWTHCVVGDGGARLLASGIEIPFYEIPHQDAEMCSVSHGVRLTTWRSVGRGLNKFAIEAFIDEIATDQAIDPYQFRRTLMRNSPRARKVLDTVAEMAEWGGAVPVGRARGIAFAECAGSLAAGVAEISVDEASWKIRVHRFWCAVDAGIIVQPLNAEAQLEGGIANGLSNVLLERVTVKDGEVQQSNYHDYPILRMSDMPQIEVRFISSHEPPTGLGEVGVPITSGAVAGAFASLTGKRLRHLPFSADRVNALIG